MLSERKGGIRNQVEKVLESGNLVEKKLKFLTTQLMDPKNRTKKTALQQCDMFDKWLNEIDDDN